MKKVISLIALSLICVSFFASALSQTNDYKAHKQAMAQERFQALDANRDGKLSYAELQNNQKHRERFDKADTNHDGGLSQDELKQSHLERKQKRQERRAKGREKMQLALQKMQVLDTNKDQAFTRTELGNEMPKLSENFSIIDGNNDGRITREEIKIARMAMGAERQSQAK